VSVIVETAAAKINLALHVRTRRADGYHELETLFAFLRDGDIVTVARVHDPVSRLAIPAEAGISNGAMDTRIAPSLGFRWTDEAGGAIAGEKVELAIIGPFAEGLAGHDNLVTRAAFAFRAAFAPGGRWNITLDKRLPIASGIGGGSADAAATLRALARLEGVDLADPKLFAIADVLGSDVPACLFSRCALGTGRGEQLTPVDGLSGIPVLLVNPGVGVSTAAVFAGWGGTDLGGIAAGDPLAAAIAGRNDLQPPALALAPIIAQLLDLLGAQPGVILSRMSGSGATCFALFESRAAQATAARAIASTGWWCLESVLA